VYRIGFLGASADATPVRGLREGLLQLGFATHATFFCARRGSAMRMRLTLLLAAIFALSPLDGATEEKHIADVKETLRDLAGLGHAGGGTGTRDTRDSDRCRHGDPAGA
jgi:hypothetical protein